MTHGHNEEPVGKQGERGCFNSPKEQKINAIAGAKVGGQPGENPPLLIASMFHNKDKILTDRKGNFDRVRAIELIRQQEALTASTGIPGLVAMVANSAGGGEDLHRLLPRDHGHALRHRHVGR